MKYQDVINEIHAGVFRPMYVLHGDEPYLITHVLQTLEDKVLNKATSELDSRTSNFENKSSKIPFQELIFELQTPSFMSEKRLLILKNTALFTSTGTAYEKYFNDLIDASHDQAILIIQEEKFEKRKKKLIDKVHNAGGVFVEFSKNDMRALLQWVRAFFKMKNLEIESNAAESLIERCNREMFLLRNEMQKIHLAIKDTDHQIIDFALIEQLSIPDFRGSIFDLTDFLAKRDVENTLRIYNNLLAQGESPIYMLFMIARHFRQLLVATSCNNQSELMQKLSIGSYVAGKLWRQKNSLDVGMFKYLYSACAETDYKIKSGQVEEKIGLEMLLLSAMQGNS